jgi:hypothetical protein
MLFVFSNSPSTHWSNSYAHEEANAERTYWHIEWALAICRETQISFHDDIPLSFTHGALRRKQEEPFYLLKVARWPLQWVAQYRIHKLLYLSNVWDKARCTSFTTCRWSPLVSLILPPNRVIFLMMYSPASFISISVLVRYLVKKDFLCLDVYHDMIS